MQVLSVSLLWLAVLLAVHCGASQDAINPDLVNSDVQRSIDLSSHLPKVSTSVTLENTGKTAVTSFLYVIDQGLASHLSYIGAVIKSGDEDQKLQTTEAAVVNQQGKTFYRINLAAPLEAGKQVTVDVDTVYSHTLKPYPSHITQAEKQFMKFEGNLYFYSPYVTRSLTTTVNTATSNIETYTKTKPVSVSDSTITYGPHKDLEPFSQGELAVHYENNTPFLAVTSLTRVIEVSHWGNIAVEETINIRHSGAILKGPFSRYDYQRSQDGVSSIKSYKTILPSSARDVYYRDEIGNISTSHLREQDELIEVELRPRFPLFGGWKTHYILGYNVPSYQYLYTKGDNYVLKMRFLDHIFDDQVIDDITLKIILPEGSKSIEFEAPYPVRRSPNEQHYTYLDTLGRPVVVVHKSNLVEQHVQDFQVQYVFNRLMLLQEPLLAVAFFYLLFLTVIIYVRMDFSITKDEASESKMRVAGLIENAQAAQDKRSALYQSYDDAINKYKTSKDSVSFNTNRKKIDTDYKTLSQQINGFLSKIKSEGSDAADKITELQRLDTQVREQINLAIQYAEKLIAGKLSKSQYVDYETAVRTKREEIYQKMETLLSSL